jgi:hypothetical protein
MIAIVSIGGRWKDDEKIKKIFHRIYYPQLKRIVHNAQRRYGIEEPKIIRLRPLYVRSNYEIRGSASWDHDKGFEIAMNMEMCCREKDKGLSTLIHEIAHIVTAIKYGDWSHGENFDKVESFCKK